MSIYFVILRFFTSSMITAIIDFIVFILCYAIFANVLTALAAGRIIAIMVNFLLNKKFVFNSTCKPRGAFVRYMALVVLNAFLSYLMIIEFQTYLHLSVLTAKIFAELILFLVSFSVQRNLVFHKE